MLIMVLFQKLEQCQRSGLIRNLGLSNFNEEQVEEIWKSATFKPQVLQVELHTYFQQQELRAYCNKRDIIVTAYAPLGSPGAKDHFVNKYQYRYIKNIQKYHFSYFLFLQSFKCYSFFNFSPEVFPDLFTVPEVVTIAKKFGKTPAQILLNFLVEQKIVVIPKSTNKARMKVKTFLILFTHLLGLFSLIIFFICRKILTSMILSYLKTIKMF